MSNWSGMNLAQVKSEGKDLDRIAGELKTLQTAVETEVREIESNWNGQDSKDFVKKWDGDYKAKIEKAIKLLEEMAGKVASNASAQGTTSS
jgi:WXG100 family type VII secretion target